MPIYDFECNSCGYIVEHYAEPDEQMLICDRCGGEAKRIFSSGHAHPRFDSEDAPWLKSVRVVVNKDGGPHCQEFLRNPTRENYKNWMKGEGLRPFEPGEEKRQRPDIDAEISAHGEKVWKQYQKNTRIELGGNNDARRDG